MGLYDMETDAFRWAILATTSMRHLEHGSRQSITEHQLVPAGRYFWPSCMVLDTASMHKHAAGMLQNQPD